MNDRDSLPAHVGEINRILEEYSTLEYFQQPIPSEIDFLLDDVVQKIIKTNPERRAEFQSLLAEHSRSLFGIYGHRAATRAQREDQPDLLNQGMAAAVFANYVIPNTRCLEISLAVYHHAARKLGLDPVDLFTAAANYADSDLAAQLVAFGNRDDVVLKQYGWKEINAPDGIRFKFGWR